MIPEPARNAANGGLQVRTVAVPDPGDLISRLPQPDALAWARRGEGLAGWGEAARVTLPPGADRFAAAEKWFQSLIETAHVEDHVGVPGTGPVAFGSFTFDAASEGSVLVRRRAARVDALVLADTAVRGAAAEADRVLGAALLSSAKDQEEHAYAATGMRDALGPLCERLVADPAPFLLRLANVQHLATSVTGTLAPDARGRVPSALAVAARLHPTAAVCGTPAEAAMEFIHEPEGMDRGRYAGPVGWLDADGNGEWGIALRCAELDGDRTRLFAGCGIVAGSDPAAELAEAQAKFRPVQDAIDDKNP